MPRYYCDYCDIFLTHDSMKARKDHVAGYKHREQVRNYYAAIVSGYAQQAIDAMTTGRVPMPGTAVMRPGMGLGSMMRPPMPGMPPQMGPRPGMPPMRPSPPPPPMTTMMMMRPYPPYPQQQPPTQQQQQQQQQQPYKRSPMDVRPAFRPY